MRYLNFIVIGIILLGLVSCFPIQRLAREFNEHKHNKVVLLIPPSESDIFSFYYPADPYKYDFSDSIYDLNDSRFLHHIPDSVVVDLFMRGLTNRLDQYNIRYLIPDTNHVVLQKNEKAYMFSVAQMEMLEYIDTATIRADSVYLKIPGEKYAYIYSASEVEEIDFPDTDEKISDLDRAEYVREYSRTNVEANSWLEFTELEKPGKPMQVLFSMQYTSDMIDGYFFIEYPEKEVKYSQQSYMIFINDVLDLVYFSGYKNGEYIADHLFNLFLEERLGEEDIDHYYKYNPFRNIAQKANDDRFIIMEP